MQKNDNNITTEEIVPEAEEPKKESLGIRFAKEVYSFCKTAAIAFLAVFILTKVFFLNAVVPTASMDPTIPAKSLMICSRMDYWFSEPERGDIIVFRRSNGDEKVYTKRVVGLPGDKIEIINGMTYINDILYEEPWLKETPEDISFGPYYLGSTSYFCMGDNRNNSNDCRYWPEHFVSENNVLAKAKISISTENGVKLLGN